MIVMEQETKNFLRSEIFGALPENCATSLGVRISERF